MISRRVVMFDKYRKGEPTNVPISRGGKGQTRVKQANDQLRPSRSGRPSSRDRRRTSTLRLPRACRYRPFARPSKQRLPCRRPAKIGGWIKLTSKYKWAAWLPLSKPIVRHRHQMSSCSRPMAAPIFSVGSINSRRCAMPAPALSSSVASTMFCCIGNWFRRGVSDYVDCSSRSTRCRTFHLQSVLCSGSQGRWTYHCDRRRQGRRWRVDNRT